VQKRLRRVEGQVRGLQRMVGEAAYCTDVLAQVSAATKALQSVALELLQSTCRTVSKTPFRPAGQRRTRSA
jgi:CsoR family transcriptional regulator, copper-sensing transcriptional repressor